MNIKSFNDETIIKCNLIAFRKLHRSFSIKISLFKYREQMNNKDSIGPQSQPMKQEEITCIQCYLNFFNQQKIMKILNIFIMELLPLNYDINLLLQNKTENLCLSNETYYSQLTSELDNPIHNITMKVIQNLMEKFPKECIGLVHILI